jgi:hypothetical protein
VEGYRLALETEDLELRKAEAERLDRELLKGVGFQLVRTPKSRIDSQIPEDCGADDGA